MIRIAFIGAGGVGGYFGGLMSAHYKNSKDVEICFICKKNTADKIRKDALILETTHGDYKIHPKLFNQGKNINIIFDFIFCCTKSFDLLESLIPLNSFINKETVIIPLQNGVDSYDKIKSVYPDVKIWDACVYIVARVIEIGHIKETGGIQLLFFGSRDQFSPGFQLMENLFIDAGIKAKYSNDILNTIWEKFLFISSIATITSCLDKSIGDILANEKYKSEFHSLLLELKAIAEAKKIVLPDEVIESIYSKMQILPYEATSSMHRDFQNGHSTELETLTGAVVKMARALDMVVPHYEQSYLHLKLKKSGITN